MDKAEAARLPTPAHISHASAWTRRQIGPERRHLSVLCWRVIAAMAEAVSGVPWPLPEQLPVRQCPDPGRLRARVPRRGQGGAQWARLGLNLSAGSLGATASARTPAGTALAVLYAGTRELPAGEAADLMLSLTGTGPACICPPDLLARGGYQGNCPAEHGGSPS